MEYSEYKLGGGLDAVHISSNLAMHEAARSGFFTFIVDKLDGIVAPTYGGRPETAIDNNRYARAGEVLRLNVISAPAVGYSVGKHQYKRGNEVVNFAGVPEFKSGSIKVDDIVGVNTKGILYAWLGLAYNVHTRAGGRMVNYKKDCTLIEYTQDYVPIRIWRLYGCFVTEIQESEFDKTNDNPRQLTATILYDRAVMIEENTPALDPSSLYYTTDTVNV